MRAEHRSARLAHGWRLVRRAGVSDDVVREFVRPAVRAIPKTMAARLGFCRITLLPRLAGEDEASRWRQADDGLEIEVATEDTEAHDVAIELLLCLGQALWGLASAGEGQAYLWLLAAELDAERAAAETILASRHRGRVRSLPLARRDGENRTGAPARRLAAKTPGSDGGLVPSE